MTEFITFCSIVTIILGAYCVILSITKIYGGIVMYHIAYQEFDDVKFASFHSTEDLKTFMKKEGIQPDDVWLVEGGNMISGLGNKHMPKGYK